MRGDRSGANATPPHLLLEEAHNGALLRGVEPLLVVVAKHHDAQIALVLSSHVRSLVVQWSALPDASRGIDGKVVSDIAKGLWSALEVGTSNGLEPLAGCVHRRIGERGHAIVVDGDAANWGHGRHAFGHGGSASPGGPCPEAASACGRGGWLVAWQGWRGVPDRAGQFGDTRRSAATGGTSAQ